MNLNSLVFTSSDYKLTLTVTNSKSFTTTTIVGTLEEVKYTAKQETEALHVIGTSEAVALKGNAITYDGNLQMQAGELEQILKLAGISFITHATNATISLVALNGAFSRVFKDVIFDSHEGGTKAKDKDSKVTLNWKALSVK